VQPAELWDIKSCLIAGAWACVVSGGSGAVAVALLRLKLET